MKNVTGLPLEIERQVWIYSTKKLVNITLSKLSCIIKNVTLSFRIGVCVGYNFRNCGFYRPDLSF